MAILATDSWPGADNADIGANWSVVTSESSFKIVSTKVRPTSNTSDAHEYYNAVTFPNDQYSQVVVELPTASGGAGTGVGVMVRASNAARTYYRFVLATPGNGVDSLWELGRMVTGTYTPITSGSVVTSGNTAVVYLEAQGTTLVAKVDGATVATQTDANIASGRAGLAHSSNTDAGVTLDNWVGGDFGAGVTNTDRQTVVGTATVSGVAPISVVGVVAVPQTP